VVVPTPKGLLPGRGPGRGADGALLPAVPSVSAGAGASVATGAAAAGASGMVGSTCPGRGPGRGPGIAAAGRAGIGGPAAGACAWLGAGAAAATGAGAGRGADNAEADDAGADDAGADEAARAGFAGAAAGKASFSRRATGASTVDDALFTYSPSSLSFASTVLLSSPSSFASSWTRALPGIGLLSRGRRQPARPRRYWDNVFIVRASSLAHVGSPALFDGGRWTAPDGACAE